MGWDAYYNTLRHDAQLYRDQAAIYVGSLVSEVGLHPHQRVLDFGCGFGHVAALVAPRVEQLWLWEPSLHMRDEARRQTAACDNVTFVDLSTAETDPQDAGLLPLDLILVNSVVQYMSPSDFTTWLRRWRDMLAPTGKLVLSDLIPPGQGALSDVADALRIVARRGGPRRAVREALGGLRGYLRPSRETPLVKVGREELTRRAGQVGLGTEVLSSNLTHFRRRWTGVLSIADTARAN